MWGFPVSMSLLPVKRDRRVEETIEKDDTQPTSNLQSLLPIQFNEFRCSTLIIISYSLSGFWI
jgi:hypothetical protein